jgi:hypothetical protein
MHEQSSWWTVVTCDKLSEATSPEVTDAAGTPTNSGQQCNVPWPRARIQGREFPPRGARFILGLGIKEADKKRMLKLLARQQKGRINAEELIDLETYIQADNLLSILKAHAIFGLKNAGQKL